MMLEVAILAQERGLAYEMYDARSLSSIEIDPEKTQQRQWTWQLCTEFGYFMVPN